MLKVNRYSYYCKGSYGFSWLSTLYVNQFRIPGIYDTGSLYFRSRHAKTCTWVYIDMLWRRQNYLTPDPVKGYGKPLQP
jgi:hypothetical protein